MAASRAELAAQMAGLIVGNRHVAVFPEGPVEVADLLARARPADVAEVEAATGEDLRTVVYDSIGASRNEAWAVTIDGELVCLWGVVPVSDSVLGSRVGAVWMVSTDTVDRYPKTFWQASKRILAATLRRWDELHAGVATEYAAALRWARRLGFEVRPAVPVGPEGALFHPCVIRRSPWAS